MKNKFFYVKRKPIKKYVTKCNTGCEHKLVKDMIDITPEKSMMIVYCEICEQTF
jgi:hypothetical protein